MMRNLTLFLIVAVALSAGSQGQTTNNQSIQAALNAVNSGRRQLGRGPLKIDQRLVSSAKSAVDRQIREGGFTRHSTTEEMHATGFPDGPGPDDAFNGRRRNVAEGCMQRVNAGLIGDVKQYVAGMIQVSQTDMNEGHVVDFMAGWSHVGFYSSGPYFCIEYGKLP